jgi:RNA polymerase sigma factor (sigma-70 family)
VQRGTGEFEGFYDAEHGPLLALLYAVTGSWQLAEDLAQETFTRAYLRWRKIGRYERPDAWLRTVALNLARSGFRRRRIEARARPRLAERTAVVDPDPLPEEVERFWAYVRELPRQQATAITLSYLEGRGPAEMTDILGCSAATARVHLHRARTRLQEAMGHHLDVVESEGRP